jgi:hypothetical protein
MERRDTKRKLKIVEEKYLDVGIKYTHECKGKSKKNPMKEHTNPLH